MKHYIEIIHTVVVLSAPKVTLINRSINQCFGAFCKHLRLNKKIFFYEANTGISLSLLNKFVISFCEKMCEDAHDEKCLIITCIFHFF